MLAVCDVTYLPYMDINLQSISIYGYFVTSLTAYYSCADTSCLKLDLSRVTMLMIGSISEDHSINDIIFMFHMQNYKIIIKYKKIGCLTTQ